MLYHCNNYVLNKIDSFVNIFQPNGPLDPPNVLLLPECHYFGLLCALLSSAEVYVGHDHPAALALASWLFLEFRMVTTNYSISYSAPGLTLHASAVAS